MTKILFLSITLIFLLGSSCKTHDYVVSNGYELVTALSQASAGQSIYVVDNARIGMNGQKGVIIPGGVSIVSDGGLIYTNDIDTLPLFEIGGPGVVIDGVKLRGPDPERQTHRMEELLANGGWPAFWEVPNSIGIRSSYDLTVRNSEVWQWSYSAIYLKDGSISMITGNKIHHNQRAGLGYGVTVDGAYATIKNNTFDYNRHAIAGTGIPGTGYEASHNTVLHNSSSHPFDMHGQNGIAGTSINIHHNTFYPHPLDPKVFAIIHIRGEPETPATITHNCFVASELRAVNVPASTIVEHNIYDGCKG